MATALTQEIEPIAAPMNAVLAAQRAAFTAAMRALSRRFICPAGKWARLSGARKAALASHNYLGGRQARSRQRRPD